MARPPKNQAPDLTQAIELTSGAIDRLVCPPGKTQAFLRDSKAPGLRVRVTAGGAKSFVFEAKLNRQTIRRTIGDVRAWKIEDARASANAMRVTLDRGDDPRDLQRQKEAEQDEQKAQAKDSKQVARIDAQSAGDGSSIKALAAPPSERPCAAPSGHQRLGQPLAGNAPRHG